MNDPYAELWAAVEHAILDSPGELDASVRRAIARDDDPPELAPLLEKVRRHAYRIAHADLDGIDDDVVVEAVLAAALGAADQRRRAALEALS